MSRRLMDTNIEHYPLLSLINTPEDLRLLSKEQLPQLCSELRDFLLNSVSISSGHLASGLGVVELTVALHYVYHTPFDHLIWDVGHQAYPHKILTGRREKMTTIRQKEGLHPFPWREESPYDVLSVGHSSTSISAGLGMAMAAEKEGKQRQTVCVIGDGAITAGMAFEAMNHAGVTKSDFLVILNDNDMSISENVGALNHHLAKIISGKTYTHLRNEGKKFVQHLPPLKDLLKRTEDQLKGLVAPRTLFEEFGFNYIGPLEGHDVLFLVEMLQNMRELSGPQFLHIQTKKGKGYAPAEQDPIRWHGVPRFDPKQGTLPNLTDQRATYSNIFGDWLCEIAAQDPKLIAITPAMSEGSGMTTFAKKYPQQFIDVAIAEQHAVTLAAGFAIAGYRPVVAIYSTFLQRAYDQLIHDVAIQNLPILFAIDRAGVVGPDGPTHQGAFDLSFLRCIPNILIMTPSDENECRLMLYTGYHHHGPSAVRYPKASIQGVLCEPLQALPLGKGVIKQQGNRGIALLNFGNLLNIALEVCQKHNITLIDMRFVKPLDEALLIEVSKNHHHFVTLEENVVKGGAGSAVSEWSMQLERPIKVTSLGFPDAFIPQGSIQEIHQMLGLDAIGLEKTLLSLLH